jgi:hypothetical protein
MTLRCEHCGSPGTIQVQVTVQAPGDHYHKFTKAMFKHNDVQIISANWETTDFICGNPDCGRVSDGYGNYVTKLERRVKELEAQIAQSEKK